MFKPQGHSRSPTSTAIASDFLLVIIVTNITISYFFQVIADCCLNLDTLRYRAHFNGLRVNVYYSSLAHLKARSGLHISVRYN